MNKTVAIIDKIENGYLITDKSSNVDFKTYFIQNFDVSKIIETAAELPDDYHEKKLVELLRKFCGRENKISAIKAVREYCYNKGYGKYQGLKEAKDYVEYIKPDWKPQS